VALSGRLTVLETAISVYFWKAAWMRTCCSGGMSRTVTNRSLRSWGTPEMPAAEPFLASSAFVSGL
jgi:hypothetical protein